MIPARGNSVCLFPRDVVGSTGARKCTRMTGVYGQRCGQAANREQTVGDIDRCSCGWQLQEGQGEVKFRM